MNLRKFFHYHLMKKNSTEKILAILCVEIDGHLLASQMEYSGFKVQTFSIT